MTRARAGLLALAAHGALGCQTSSPLVRDVSVRAVDERTARQVVLATEDCAPPFDLDRGALASDPTATLWLGGGARGVQARRSMPERFDATLPDDLLPGSYEVMLELSDGRRAPYAGRIDVVPRDPVLERTSSARTSVAIGEQSVPVVVTLSNPSLCALTDVVVAPRFARDGVDRSGDFTVRGARAVRVEPATSRALELLVDITTAAAVGEYVIDARATGERAGGGGCVGAVAVGAALATQRWQVVLPAQQSLDVVAVVADPIAPRLGQGVVLSVDVLNRANVAVDVEAFAVASEPAGIVLTRPPDLMEPGIAAGQTRTFLLDVKAREDAPTGVPYVVRVSATARDAQRNLHVTRGDGAAATIVVRGAAMP